MAIPSGLISSGSALCVCVHVYVCVCVCTHAHARACVCPRPLVDKLFNQLPNHVSGKILKFVQLKKKHYLKELYRLLHSPHLEIS